MHKLCPVDPAEGDRLLERTRRFVRKLKKALPVRQVYLYGSLARGDIHEGSDIDLIVIGDFEERLFERIGKVLELTDLPIEPLVYTPEEFEKMKKDRNPLIIEVLRSGITIE